MNYTILLERIDLLCAQNNVKKTVVFDSCGAGKDFAANIKKGSIPTVEKVQQIAAYFNVSTDYLLGQISEAEELLRHTSDDNKRVFDKFIVALSQLNKNGQEIAYDYIDTLVKSGKYSPDSENTAISIAAKGGRTATIADNSTVDAEIAKRKRRKS